MSAALLVELLATQFGVDGKMDYEAAFAFMRAFSPCTLRIPPMDVVERLARSRRMIERVAKDPSQDSVRATSQFYGTDARQATKGFSGSSGMTITAYRAAKAAGLNIEVPSRMIRREKKPSTQMGLFDAA